MTPRQRATFVWVALFAVPCCVSVLDLEDYGDVVVELCKCDMDVPQFDGTCVETLKARLDGVSESARASWLSNYAEQCAGECGNATACFQQVGTCAQRSCSEDKECCGFEEEGGVRCIDALCSSCRPVDAECSRDEDCCDAEAFCVENTCQFEASSTVSVSSSSGGPDLPPGG